MAEPAELFQADDTANMALSERLKGIVDRLQDEASNRVSRRLPVEREWIADLEAFHSRYDGETRARLNSQSKKERSKLYIGKTGEKTRAWISRLQDILFPTDEQNWSIQPTPVPMLTREAEAAVQQAAGLQQQADSEAQQGGTSPQTHAALQTAQQKADQLSAIMDEARDRCDLMRSEMEDQLSEASYGAHCRDVIEDGCKIGTGITEGPITNERVRRGWKQQQDGTYRLQIGGDPRPAFYRVDPWNFFPSTGATCIEDSEGFLVRNIWGRTKLREFAKLSGVNRDAIRRLILLGPRDTAPTYLQQIKGYTADAASSFDPIYLVWKWCGPLSAEDMMVLAAAMGDGETALEMADIDPLEQINAIVWFCQGELLKFSIYPLDSDEPMFTRFCFEKDEGSFWGYGVPRLMRDDQKALNAAWRLMMDNSGDSAAPQIFVDRGKIEPLDGSWTITGGKLWVPKAGGVNTGFTGKELFGVDINSHQTELANIIQIALQSIDAVTMTPTIAQGEQGTTIGQTAQGMALLMNAANIMTKRVLKNYDDDKTVPEIRRLYDWNMQFNPREEIKGDYQADARGSSVLLVREMQARNLLTISLQYGGHPVYGSMLKAPSVLRETFRAHMLHADEFVKSDTEIEREAAQQAPEDPMVQIERDKLAAMQADTEAKVAIAEQDANTRLQVAQLNHDAQMAQMAEKLNMSADQLSAKLQQSREQIRAKERSQAAEIAVRSSQQAPLNTTEIANA